MFISLVLGIAVMPTGVARPFDAGFDLRVVPLTDAWAEGRSRSAFAAQGALVAIGAAAGGAPGAVGKKLGY